MKMHSRLALGVATLTAIYAGSGHALGLGELQLQSALNQPLQAIIPLHDSQGLNPSDIRVSLADADAFARIGLDRPFLLTDLRFTPVRVGQQLAIEVQSSRPVREPYLNFLVQLDRGNGALLREYTLLLDPPLYAPVPVTASAAAASSRVAPPAEPDRPVATFTDNARAVAPRALPTLQPEPGAAHYQSRPGDSLWGIARDTRVEPSVSVQRQMDAILALNPQAFVNGDPGRLRIDQLLVLPSARQLGLDPAAASPSAEEAVAQSARPREAPFESADQLRIEEPLVQTLTEETEAMQQRLSTLESRFHGLLAELEARDAQIASLQAELEVLRQARDTLVVSNAGLPEEPLSGGLSSVAEAHSEPSDPGSLESVRDLEPADSASWVSRWWPALLAGLTVLLGALMLRSRGRAEGEPEPALPEAPGLVPQTVIVPGSRTVDPLEGVDLYLTYGRLDEARDMLGKAIAAEPGRIDLRMRMLGVLAELGDARQFAEQEREARALGADQLHIDQLKTRHPQWLQARQETVEPIDESEVMLPGDDNTLDLNSFELDPSWDMFDDLAGPDGRRPGKRSQSDEAFESNLQDFPEVGELDDYEPGQFQHKDGSRNS